MSAARHDIEIEENADFTFELTWKDANCDPRDVTGWGAQFQVRMDESSTSTELYSAASTNSKLTVSGVSGRFKVDIPQTEINAATTWEKAYYELRAFPNETQPTVDAVRLVQGKARWKPSVINI